VAEVVGRIAAGEIFQANIARGWGGRLGPGVRPIDLFQRLHVDSPAPFGGYLRLPGRAVVSNSPERFVSIAEEGGLRVEARPIKGTRPRGSDPDRDQALMRELLACEKDRAENLMIVDLMRNDLSRVCPAGAVGVTELFAIESFANVHHLVSTVTGRLRSGLTSLDLLEAAFPPGSITGAPKIQAMKVIADYEGPRGPYCGSLFWAGCDGAGDSSVLIRTVGLIEDQGGWRFEARAGAGIVADSDPHLERLETEAKIDAIRTALLGPKT
jgi:para-aminobenzoate synthetase component 1